MQNVEIAKAVLSRISAGQILEVGELLLPEATMELPFAPAGVPGVTEGAESIIAALQYVPREFSRFAFHAHECYETKAGDTVILEATSIGTGRSSGLYQNRYIFVFTFKNGKIFFWKEFFDPGRL